MIPTLDLFDPELIRNPYPFYSDLRETAPILKTSYGSEEVLVLSRFEDVARILNDKNTTVNQPGSREPMIFKNTSTGALWRNSISRMDPPRHTKTRRVAARSFTSVNLEKFKPIVTEITEKVFNEVGTNNIDIVEEISTKIPLLVICKLLGIPSEDWNYLQTQTESFLRIFLPYQISEKELDQINLASKAFVEYFQKHINSAQNDKSSDVMEDLIIGPLKEGLITTEQLIGLLRGLFTAGFETTAATISASFLAFSKYPDQFNELIAQRVNMAKVVDEMLRWETPVQGILRYTGTELTINSTKINMGQPLLLLTGSSNRDPSRYQCPNQVDFSRDATDHHAFGGGRHYCLGAGLAKLELEAVFYAISNRFSKIEIGESKIVRRQNLQFRSITSLPAILSWG